MFATRGYHGTSFSGIAAEMGAPKSAIGYHHFATKEDIATAIVERQRARWAHLIQTVTETSDTGLEQLLTILLSAALDARRAPLAAAAARLLVEKQSADIAFPGSSFRWRTVARDLIQRSIDDGDIVSPRSAEEIAGLILTTSFGVFTAENNGFEHPDTEEHLRNLWSDLLVSLGVPKPTDVLDKVTALVLPEEA